MIVYTVLRSTTYNTYAGNHTLDPRVSAGEGIRPALYISLIIPARLNLRFRSVNGAQGSFCLQQ